MSGGGEGHRPWPVQAACLSKPTTAMRIRWREAATTPTRVGVDGCGGVETIGGFGGRGWSGDEAVTKRPKLGGCDDDEAGGVGCGGRG